MIKLSNQTAKNLEMHLDFCKQNRDEDPDHEPDDVDRFYNQLMHQIAIALSKVERTKIPEMILIHIEP